MWRLCIPIFYSRHNKIPAALKRTAANSGSFLTVPELLLSEELSKVRNFLLL
ncbi:hypothetical protein [Lysinibacillus odysseyi]|uniref:hypothetical protein n=1 Tax=Lysinibacillus odysseyi TaxID=202611 RepID=UPI000A49A13D|nr:hypothetical protein [Lysinibacillus odysseyi]